MFKNYYENIILYDFLLKTKAKNFFELIKIKKICINISFKNIFFEKNKLIDSVLFLKLITNQKNKITKTGKKNIFLKIKKNSIIGCKITLRKNNLIIFLEKIIIFILPELNNIIINKKGKNNINFKFSNILDFIEFKKEFIKCQNVPSINISIHTNNNKLNFLLIDFLSGSFLQK